MTMFLLLALSLSAPTAAPRDTISRGAEDTIHACAPADDFCVQLHKECSSADLSLSDCVDFAALCEHDPCAACEATIERCEASGDTQCKYIVQHCEEGLAGCCSALDPDDVIRGCAPASDMCEQLGEACAADGLDAGVCDGLANLCKGARQLTCEAVAVVCEQETGGPCDNVIEVCADNLIGCAPSKCMLAGTLTNAEAIAFCYANPGRLEQCGAEPDVGVCLELMTWKECGVTTCEWAECMADLEAQGNTCPVEFPATCLKIHKCDLAENDGSVALKTKMPIGLPKPNPSDCLRLSEVFYRPEVPISGLQWLRIRNICDGAVDPTGVVLRWTNGGVWGDDVALAGLGPIGAHDCTTVGSLSTASNFYPAVDLSVSLALPDPGDRNIVEGIGLFTAAAPMPFDAVLYGENDDADLSAATGLSVDLGRIEAGHSMWWSGGWYDSDHPSPHSCQH